MPQGNDEYRVLVDRRLAVSWTRDGGKSFDVLSEGLPNVDSFDLAYRYGLAADAAHRRFAMGSTTGNLWIGDGRGERWRTVANHLPTIACVAWR